MERLLKRLGVDAGNVMALGDGENDVEMLRLAGLSVAMAGSAPKVVEAAGGNVGLSNDENGVAAGDVALALHSLTRWITRSTIVQLSFNYRSTIVQLSFNVALLTVV